jgi:hypothetical protein
MRICSGSHSRICIRAASPLFILYNLTKAIRHNYLQANWNIYLIKTVYSQLIIWSLGERKDKLWNNTWDEGEKVDT